MDPIPQLSHFIYTSNTKIKNLNQNFKVPKILDKGYSNHTAILCNIKDKRLDNVESEEVPLKM